MNDKFDELAKAMAQSVTRRGALKRFGAGLAGIALAWLACGIAEAQQFSAWSPPANLGPSINTTFNELHPAISADGLSLFFSSDRPGGFGQNDLWVAQRCNRDADWGPAQNLGPSLNTPGGEYSVELSPDGHWLFFASDGLAGGNNIRVYVVYRSDTNDDLGWGQPIDLGKGVNGDHSDADGTIFTDPQTGVSTLYFARLNTPGQGDWDIYQSIQGADGRFGDAVPVAELNTPYRETHPTVRRDGLEIIFSSNRPGSLGGIDLWFSTRPTTHDKWSTPVNLGPTVNSTSDDRGPYLSDDAQTLIFASDRPGGFGGLDFYITTRTKLR